MIIKTAADSESATQAGPTVERLTSGTGSAPMSFRVPLHRRRDYFTEYQKDEGHLGRLSFPAGPQVHTEGRAENSGSRFHRPKKFTY
ncbi:hypothetical protein R75465_08112 [Paraburkholderia aspalathi]|uniref:hypothetical protein n=1 Tax=Paraburkholderia aspalathi TaxID=1324617 RepID=UPI001AFD363E|nr:hypothetical protein [Paraburkholderia aspalathi]CAE6868243.1 hypothetical protein R75465_08112 [Paraburkholderia aspalathi]